MPKKRCVCGQSRIYPLCDGQHADQGWACGGVSRTEANLAVVGSPHLRSLADRLAHRFGGISVHQVGGAVRCERLVIVTDGHELGPLKAAVERVQAEQQQVLGIGLSGEGLGWLFPGATWSRIADDAPAALWSLAEQVLSGEASASVSTSPPALFVSHAVADEGALFPVLTALREHYGVPLFVCADSIPNGAAWKAEIQDHLQRCDRLLYVASQSANASVYCAFEVGVAMALKKPIRIISLDGSSPPSFLQDVQAFDLQRLLIRKPWLTPVDGLLEAFLDAMGEGS